MSITSDFLFCLLGSGDGAQDRKGSKIGLIIFPKVNEKQKNCCSDKATIDKKARIFLRLLSGYPMLP